MKGFIRRRLVGCLLLALVLLAAGDTAAQDASVQVIVPVTGSFALPAGNQRQNPLFLINTLDGSVEFIQKTSSQSAPIWDLQGERLAYRNYNAHSTVMSLADGITYIIEAFEGHDEYELFHPVGWSVDGSDLIYLGALAGWPSSTLTFYLMDVHSAALSTLLTLQTNQPFQNLPAELGLNGFILRDISHATRNPIYDNWVALRIQVIHPAGVHAEAMLFIENIVLWNYETGEMVGLNRYLDFPVTSSAPMAWSDDGHYLLFSTFDRRMRKGRVHVARFDESGTVEVVDEAIVPHESYTEFWLGAGNLMLSWSQDDSTTEFIYSIGEIVNGNWRETEFLRLTGEVYQFFQPGDWFIRASVEERQTLSCLLDQSLPARLATGGRGRVILTGGTLALRAEPIRYAPEITRLATDAAFDVIGGASCANGYRWWQIRLADGVTGWAAEADETDYFLEPL